MNFHVNEFVIRSFSFVSTEFDLCRGGYKVAQNAGARPWWAAPRDFFSHKKVQRGKFVTNALQLEYRPIEALIPYARNSRTHTAAQIAQIAASIREFGFTNPVLVDGDSGIIAGHGRVLAARKLGLTEIPCIELAHMDENQKRAYIIADNQLAVVAGWDDDALQVELEALHDAGFDLKLLGFGPDDLAMKLGIGVDFDPGTQDGQSRLDQKAPITCPHCGNEFTPE